MSAQPFIEKTFALLAKSNISIPSPCVKEITYNDEGREVRHGYFADSNRPTNLRGNIELLIVIYFSIIDAYVDAQNPSFEGKNLLDKYRNLPKSTHAQQIFAEVYRVLRTLRNTVIHQRTKIIEANDIISLDYINNHGKHLRVEISIRGLGLLGAIIYRITSEARYNTEYGMGMLRGYYNDFSQELKVFQDDISSGVTMLSSGLRLERNVRYRVIHPDYSITGDIINLTIKVDENEYLIDYLGKEYLIPREVIPVDGTIKVSELSKWEAKKENLYSGIPLVV